MVEILIKLLILLKLISTGEVNYYSRPCMGTVLCDIVYDTSKSSLRISFEEKDLSEEQIKTKFEEKYQWLKETQK